MKLALLASVPTSLATLTSACSKSSPDLQLANNLNSPDQNGLALLQGFRSRIVARSGEPPSKTSAYTWHAAPDAGGTFATDDGGWIYVSNGEMSDGRGGVGALRFDNSGQLIDAYPILAHTSRNCGGGVTPWQTWLSGEEIEGGTLIECDPYGQRNASRHLALGRFVHEGAAVDPRHNHLYMTEDTKDGRFYRFVPATGKLSGPDDLLEGRLQVAILGRDTLRVEWRDIPDPYAVHMETRHQIEESTVFRGGEGIVHHHGKVFFATKGDNRIWVYDTSNAAMNILYDARTSLSPLLTGVDTLAVTPDGTVYVAEDKGNMKIVALRPNGEVVPVVQVMNSQNSEVTGPAFSPDGKRLYFSSQRGTAGRSSDGVTYEVTGPWVV